MSIYFLILFFQLFLQADWHNDHSHQYSISYSFDVDKPIKEVRDFYVNMQEFAAAHPLIDSANCLTVGDYCYQYEIYEQPFSWIPSKIKYQVEIENPNYLQVITYNISEIPFVTPTISYVFNALDENKTSGFIEVKVEGSWLFRRMLGNKMMRAQKVVIEERF